MTEDDLSRAMSSGGDIVPSSGFVSRVIDAVRDEGAAPPPIPFPWRRAWPLAAALLAVLAGAAAVVSRGVPVETTGSWAPLAILASVGTWSLPQIPRSVLAAALIAAALVVSFVCFRFSIRLTGRRS